MKPCHIVHSITAFLLLAVPAAVPGAEGPPLEACLSLCSEPDPDFKALMKKSGVPAFPGSCSYGSGRGGGLVHKSFLVMDSPEAAVRWYRGRLKDWHEFKDEGTHVLYAGPEVNMNDPEIREFGWDYSERTRVEVVGEKQHYGLCEWPTTITIHIND